MPHRLVTDPFVYHVKQDTTPVQGPLGGLRLAVKDLFHIAGLPTTAGHPKWSETHGLPQQSNSVVQALLHSGANLVGKTITDELAYSLNGQNIHYGTPVLSQQQKRLPGGSSSGSAIAVASGLADIGLGTDTGGSIRVPSSYNGLWGLRPTHGLLSCENMVPLAPGFDTVGWMTRDLHTFAKVARVLLPQRVQQHGSEYTVLLAGTLIDQVAHQQVIKHWLSQSKLPIEGPGNSISPNLLGLASEAFRVLQGAEIWQTHGDWISNKNIRLADDIQARMEWSSCITDKQIETAREQQQQVKRTVLQLLTDKCVLLMPTTPGYAPFLDEQPQALAQYRNSLLGLTALAGLCGLPQLHIPLACEQAHAGISLLGPANSDWALIQIAQQLTEQENHI